MLMQLICISLLNKIENKNYLNAIKYMKVILLKLKLTRYTLNFYFSALR